MPLAAHGKLTEASAGGLEGSPEKDVTNATIGTVAGAEVDSRSSTLSRGACLVGVHGPSATDALNACLLGSWTSAFTLLPLGELDPAAPKILKLPRSVAQEFLLAAASGRVL